MHSFIKEERGSFTMEATLVFPGFLMFTLICVFFCIVIFQIGTANYVAQKAASQVAYTWNNSNKDLETGEFPKNFYTGIEKGGDGLYWRVFDNDILGIFGLSGFFHGDKGLIERKEGKAKLEYGSAMNITVNYHNKIIYSEVEVKAKSNLLIPTFLKTAIGKTKVEATATRVVTDTPELIRNFNFAKYVWKESGLEEAYNGIKDSIKSFFGN